MSRRQERDDLIDEMWRESRKRRGISLDAPMEKIELNYTGALIFAWGMAGSLFSGLLFAIFLSR